MIKFSAKITGNALNGFPRSLKQLSAEGQAKVRMAVIETAQAVAEKAKRLVPVSSGSRASRKARGRPGAGELRSTIRAEASKSGAPVAYVLAGYGKLRRRSSARTTKGKRRAAARRAGQTPQRDLGIYAMVIEYGSPHRGVAARPFLRPARESERPAFVFRVRAALEAATRAADR